MSVLQSFPGAVDPESTLVRRGEDAKSIREMEEFVDSIKERPLDRLLGDLPGLSSLSETKFLLARQVMRRRIRELPEVERDQLRLFASEVASGVDEETAARIRWIFE